MENLFKDLDILNKGYLTKDSFFMTFKRNVKNIDMEEVVQMMEEMNLSSKAKIDFE